MGAPAFYQSLAERNIKASQGPTLKESMAAAKRDAERLESLRKGR